MIQHNTEKSFDRKKWRLLKIWSALQNANSRINMIFCTCNFMLFVNWGKGKESLCCLFNSQKNVLSCGAYEEWKNCCHKTVTKPDKTIVLCRKCFSLVFSCKSLYQSLAVWGWFTCQLSFCSMSDIVLTFRQFTVQMQSLFLVIDIYSKLVTNKHSVSNTHFNLFIFLE